MKRKQRPTAAAEARQKILDRADELKKSHGRTQHTCMTTFLAKVNF